MATVVRIVKYEIELAKILDMKAKIYSQVGITEFPDKIIEDFDSQTHIVFAAFTAGYPVGTMCVNKGEKDAKGFLVTDCFNLSATFLDELKNKKIAEVLGLAVEESHRGSTYNIMFLLFKSIRKFLIAQGMDAVIFIAKEDKLEMWGKLGFPLQAISSYSLNAHSIYVREHLRSYFHSVPEAKPCILYLKEMDDSLKHYNPFLYDFLIGGD
jgi:hypothetical protein